MTIKQPASPTVWAVLSSTLRARRNLQRHRGPESDIGRYIRPNPFEGAQDFQQRRKARIAYELSDRRSMLERYAIKTPDDLERKIQELEAEEKRLWVTCRPDLYGPGGFCEH